MSWMLARSLISIDKVARQEKRHNDDGSLIRQIFLKEKPNTSRMHFEILRGYFTSRINTSEKKNSKPKGSEKINLFTMMITALASYDQERAAQANWLNAAYPICLSRGCVQYRKRNTNKQCVSWNTNKSNNNLITRHNISFGMGFFGENTACFEQSSHVGISL